MRYFFVYIFVTFKWRYLHAILLYISAIFANRYSQEFFSKTEQFFFLSISTILSTWIFLCANIQFDVNYFKSLKRIKKKKATVYRVSCINVSKLKISRWTPYWTWSTLYNSNFIKKYFQIVDIGTYLVMQTVCTFLLQLTELLLL